MISKVLGMEIIFFIFLETEKCVVINLATRIGVDVLRFAVLTKLIQGISIRFALTLLTFEAKPLEKKFAIFEISRVWEATNLIFFFKLWSSSLEANCTRRNLGLQQDYELPKPVDCK